MGCPELSIESYFRIIRPDGKPLLRPDGTCTQKTAYSRFSQPVVSNYRYYSPQLGRWMSRDPIGEVGGCGLYGFCFNNSIYYYDVNGLLWKEIIGIAGVGLGVAGGVVVITATSPAWVAAGGVMMAVGGVVAVYEAVSLYGAAEETAETIGEAVAKKAGKYLEDGRDNAELDRIMGSECEKKCPTAGGGRW